MLPAEWGRARDVQPAATHRIVIVIAWRGRPAAAVLSSGLRVQAPAGNCTNSQLLLPSCCIQPTILPYTFLCFRACILQPRDLHLHLLLHQRLRYHISILPLPLPLRCSGLLPSRPATQRPAHRALALASLPRYVALHHVE